jgi:hypothetical protein
MLDIVVLLVVKIHLINIVKISLSCELGKNNG